MKAIKSITVILLLIVGLLVVGSAALADDTAFDKVKVDGVDMTGTNTVYAERGDTIDIYVQWTAGSDDVDREDLKLNAWVDGYDYDDVEDTVVLGAMDANDTVSKTLHILLPEDMDAKETYTLHVELSGDIDIHERYKLKISPEKHKLVINDVILRPSTVAAGSTLFATVRVKNMGYKNEENIKVTVSIPDLGVSAREYIDELESDDEDNEDDDNDVKTADSTPEMKLSIPSDAKPGSYGVKILVEYDDGHGTVEKVETIGVKGAESAEAEEEVIVLVNVDSSSKEGTPETEIAYKVMVANLGNDVEVFSLEVTGADIWATTRVEPVMITLQPDGTGELFVYVKPKADLAAGKYGLTAKVKSGNTIVAEKALVADVTSATSTASTSTTGATTTNGQTNFASLKNALVIGFGVLVVLLVILGLIIAFNKMSKEEDEELPPNEGQAYY